jgi:hypothetical protein
MCTKKNCKYEGSIGCGTDNCPRSIIPKAHGESLKSLKRKRNYAKEAAWGQK